MRRNPEVSSSLRSSFLFLSALLASASAWPGEAPAAPSDSLISLGTRIFDLREISRIVEGQLEEGYASLTDVDWILQMLGSDPYLGRTVIHVEDRMFFEFGTPGWLPDNLSRFHPDSSLPPLFHLDGYEVGWFSEFDAPTRGEILIFLSRDPQQLAVLCSYDRAQPKPSGCTLWFRYDPDPDLFVEVHIYRVTSPLNDWAEIAARAEALVRCLDVTEAAEAGRHDPDAPAVEEANIAAGGRCRLAQTS